MPKKPSYKKLKKENKRLLYEIYLLVKKPESLEAIETTFKYDMKWISPPTYSKSSVTVKPHRIDLITKKPK